MDFSQDGLKLFQKIDTNTIGQQEILYTESLRRL